MGFLVGTSTLASHRTQENIDRVASYLQSGPLLTVSELQLVHGKMGSIETVEVLQDALTKTSRSLTDITNQYGNLLHAAASTYESQILELLLGNFPNESMTMAFEKNKDGETPLFSAVEQDLSKNVEILLTFAQDRKKELLLWSNKKNRCVMDTAWSGSMRDTLQKYCQPLSAEESEDLTNFCLNSGKDLPRIVCRLTCQCEQEPAKIILSTLLSKMSISLCSVDKKNRNSAHVAVREIDIKMLSLLLAIASTDDALTWQLISAQDSKGRTPFHYAMMDNSVPRITSIVISVDNVTVSQENEISIETNEQKQIIQLLRDAAQKMGRLDDLEVIKDNKNRTAGAYQEQNK